MLDSITAIKVAPVIALTTTERTWAESILFWIELFELDEVDFWVVVLDDVELWVVEVLVTAFQKPELRMNPVFQLSQYELLLYAHFWQFAAVHFKTVRFMSFSTGPVAKAIVDLL